MAGNAITDVPDGSTAGRQLEVSWLSPIGMTGLSIANFIYRLFTLGIYDFWARTEVRKRLWSAIRLDGEPLVYTGTGKELFLGFIIVFGLVLLPILLLSAGIILAFGPTSPVAQLFPLALYVFIFLLFGVAIYRAQRYRLLRTSWRGIRGSLDGNSWNYGWTYFWTFLLIPLTLGWIIPWRTTKLQTLITNDAMFGDREFFFKGDAGPLYGPFAMLWIGVFAIYVGASLVFAVAIAALQHTFDLDTLSPGGQLKPEIASIVTIGTLGIIAMAYLLYLLISAWYRARTINHFAKCTHFEGAQFKAKVTGAGLLWIDVTNILILLVGALLLIIPLSIAAVLIVAVANSIDAMLLESLLGPDVKIRFAAISVPIAIFIMALSFTILLPVTQARAMGYFISHLSIEGPIALERIAQSTADQVSTGEGLAQAFDIDAF